MNSIYLAIKDFLKQQFSLAGDTDNEFEIVDAIKKSVNFKGVNLWMLIFATIIASVGLNVNATAVIIGAMLISPLMGPIMGLGLGAGINDLELVKRAANNFFTAVVISIITSAVYFYFSPLTQAQSELLSRTSPTFWDVLIALFGGLAGVLAGSSKQKGNAIPGVAIATALMPPLCTAGYGLANMNLNFFFGALYLFFINSVMIGASTFLVVRLLRFKHAEYLDNVQSNRVKYIIYFLVVLTVIPSIYLGYGIVKKTQFEGKANNFVSNEMSQSPNYFVFNRQFNYTNAKNNEIVLFIGGYMDSTQIAMKKEVLPNYGLEKCQLVIKQGQQLQELQKDEQSKLNEIDVKYSRELTAKDSIIAVLNNTIITNDSLYTNTQQILSELNVFFPKIEEMSIGDATLVKSDNEKSQTEKMIYIKNTGKLTTSQKTEVQNWLELRLGEKNLKLIFEE